MVKLDIKFIALLITGLVLIGFSVGALDWEGVFGSPQDETKIYKLKANGDVTLFPLEQKLKFENVKFTKLRMTGGLVIVPFSAWLHTGPVSVRGFAINTATEEQTFCSRANLGEFDLLGQTKAFELTCNNLEAGDYTITLQIFENDNIKGIAIWTATI